MILNETQQKWSNIISETLHVDNKEKLSWMSQYAMNHEIYESMQTSASVDGGIYATPLNTMGIGNPMMPMGVAGADGFNANGVHGAGIGNTGADFHNPLYKVGSGDIPMSTLPMALEIAAVTIGFELVPVIPSNGPWTMLSYMDTPYAGGKLGRINETWADGKGNGNENKPIYIKLNIPKGTTYTKSDFVANKTQVTFTSDKGSIVGKFLGWSRIDGNMVIEVASTTKTTGSGASAVTENVSIADVLSVDLTEITATNGSGAAAITVELGTNKTVRAELVTGAADHIQGFSNFFKDQNGNGSDDPMTRAQNETGVGNTIGARMFSKIVQMGAYEVTGTVTRQQLQDMPLYGIDVIGKVLEAMQNEISQAINNRILDRVFKLGVTNYEIQRDYQGIDLNLYFGNTASDTKALSDFAPYKAGKFVNINNEAPASVTIQSCTNNTASENVITHQRRIMSRLLAAANIIANVSRRGRANWAVTNTHVLSALQDSAAFVVAPMNNSLTQAGEQSLYFAGQVAGLNLYVDPYMTWDDCRVCVGRKSDGNTPGVIFMPYILADTVQTVVEGTMAPKLLVNSRFAIVDAGFYPEQNYYTFMIDDSGANII
jgi:hypothetical protein